MRTNPEENLAAASPARFDVVIIGAGIVGLASARELLRRRRGLRLAVVDKEPDIGRHQTGHNSGVIHAGVYYAPGSLKAQLCVQGARDLYAYCAEKGIPAERCGKVIVASTEAELPRLEDLHRRGLANGVEGLELIGPERLREIEPHCVGVRALFSPNTGIVDFSQVAQAYADDVRASGGELFLGQEARSIEHREGGVTIELSTGSIHARHVISCAGLHSDRVARKTGAPREPRIVPFRGSYWLLRPERRHLARHLIYPVPDPALPFLGVHFTRRIADGAVWLGPNAVLAFKREGYRRRDIDLRDLFETLAFGGFRRLAARYRNIGVAELVRDFSKGQFLRSLQRYVPELAAGDLLPGPSGVRAQAVAGDGAMVDDFVVNVQGTSVVHVRNAPSPAATSSLAIGRLIADKADEVLRAAGAAR